MISDIFCKIISGELKSDIVWQDDDFIVIKDIHPEAPVHLLIIPKRHITDLKELSEGDASLLGKAFLVAEKAALSVGVSESGYRLILNEGEHAGKLVPHLHIHLIGGGPLGFKLIK